MVKNSPPNAGDLGECGFDPWVGKIPWRRAWQPTPVFLPGESHGQRSLGGCSPWGHKDSDTTEATADTHRCAAICRGPASDGPGGRPLPSRPLLHSLTTTLDGSDGGCLLSLTVRSSSGRPLGLRPPRLQEATLPLAPNRKGPSERATEQSPQAGSPGTGHPRAPDTTCTLWRLFPEALLCSTAGCGGGLRRIQLQLPAPRCL